MSSRSFPLRRWFAHACTFAVALLLAARPLVAQSLLLPMDDVQRNHLKAYGVTFFALKSGQKAEWLLNYRGGSFLLADSPDLRRRAALDGVSVEPMTDAAVAAANRAGRGPAARRDRAG